jgi:hypothetical protein
VVFRARKIFFAPPGAVSDLPFGFCPLLFALCSLPLAFCPLPSALCSVPCAPSMQDGSEICRSPPVKTALLQHDCAGAKRRSGRRFTARFNMTPVPMAILAWRGPVAVAAAVLGAALAPIFGRATRGRSSDEHLAAQHQHLDVLLSLLAQLSSLAELVGSATPLGSCDAMDVASGLVPDGGAFPDSSGLHWTSAAVCPSNLFCELR